MAIEYEIQTSSGAAGGWRYEGVQISDVEDLQLLTPFSPTKITLS
jgi:hypothetical protein